MKKIIEVFKIQFTKKDLIFYGMSFAIVFVLLIHFACQLAPIIQPKDIGGFAWMVGVTFFVALKFSSQEDFSAEAGIFYTLGYFGILVLAGYFSRQII